MDSAQSPLIWVLTDDRAGNVAQARGVAEALNRPFLTREIRYSPFARLPNALQGASRIGLDVSTRMQLMPPWPDVVIAAGRRTAPVARWIKRRARKPVILVQVMDPRAGRADFDLIAIPNHDTLRGAANGVELLRVTGAPHRLTPARLAEAKAAWSARLQHLPRPFIALVVGGATHSRAFPAACADDLGRRVASAAKAAGGTILMTTSRRTGSNAQEALLAHIPEPRHTYVWGQGGDNPYLGYLALADAIVVTGDSVSMCSEACAAGAPVYIYAPEDMVSAKHARLHDELYRQGLARPLGDRLGDRLETWTHPPLNAAADIARALDALIRRRFS